MADAESMINAEFKNDDADFVAPPKPGKFKFNQPGDTIKGTFLSKKPFTGDYGETVIYEIMAEKGHFHEKEEGGEAVPLEPGQKYGIFDHFSFHDEIEQAHVGQRLIVTFVNWKDSTQRKGKQYKVIACTLDPKFVPKPKAPPVDPMA